ncbi:TRAP transporter substrate-binding protein DctP (plasmid) [Salipiger sp. H15]|uniref:TRAP transporter substrate-binding protein DctP n=1 Tax=Alloyangia sp. H15 TaxID=3029062 RepID=A0AAU8AR28_9RHOB
MAYSEPYVTLQNNVVDGAEGSPDTMISDRFVEVSEFYNLTKLQYMAAPVVMSGSQFDRLSPENQTLVMEVADEARAHAIQVYLDGYVKALDEIRAAGLEVVETPNAELVEATRDVATQLIAAAPDGEANFKLFEQVAGK